MDIYFWINVIKWSGEKTVNSCFRIINLDKNTRKILKDPHFIDFSRSIGIVATFQTGRLCEFLPSKKSVISQKDLHPTYGHPFTVICNMKKWLNISEFITDTRIKCIVFADSVVKHPIKKTKTVESMVPMKLKEEKPQIGKKAVLLHKIQIPILIKCTAAVRKYHITKVINTLYYANLFKTGNVFIISLTHKPTINTNANVNSTVNATSLSKIQSILNHIGRLSNLRTTESATATVVTAVATTATRMKLILYVNKVTTTSTVVKGSSLSLPLELTVPECLGTLHILKETTQKRKQSNRNKSNNIVTICVNKDFKDININAFKFKIQFNNGSCDNDTIELESLAGDIVTVTNPSMDAMPSVVPMMNKLKKLIFYGDSTTTTTHPISLPVRVDGIKLKTLGFKTDLLNQQYHYNSSSSNNSILLKNNSIDKVIFSSNNFAPFYFQQQQQQQQQQQGEDNNHNECRSNFFWNYKLTNINEISFTNGATVSFHEKGVDESFIRNVLNSKVISFYNCNIYGFEWFIWHTNNFLTSLDRCKKKRSIKIILHDCTYCGNITSGLRRVYTLGVSGRTGNINVEILGNNGNIDCVGVKDSKNSVHHYIPLLLDVASTVKMMKGTYIKAMGALKSDSQLMLLRSKRIIVDCRLNIISTTVTLFQ